MEALVVTKCQGSFTHERHNFLIWPSLKKCSLPISIYITRVSARKGVHVCTPPAGKAKTPDAVFSSSLQKASLN